MPRKHLGHRRIGDPAVIACAELLQFLLRTMRIAHAVDVEGQIGVATWLQQEIDDLAAALSVAPIADPYEPFAVGLFGRRMEAARVRRLVPDEGAVAPSRSLVHLR